MPISECTNNTVTYPAAHWESMKMFLEDAIRESGYEPRAVWESLDQSVIHSRIVNNIAEFPLMICVICGSNANVMIELGLRLMTDKPVLVIYEENSQPPFDVNVLQMFPMPTKPDYKDYQILKDNIKTALPKMLDPNYKSFLSNFKPITPKGINGTEKIEISQFMNETREAIQNIQSQISILSLQREVRDSERMQRELAMRNLSSPNSLDRIDQGTFRHTIALRLARLRTSINAMTSESTVPHPLVEQTMEELSSIQNEARRRDLDDYVSIRHEIMRLREKLSLAVKTE